MAESGVETRKKAKAETVGRLQRRMENHRPVPPLRAAVKA